MNEVEELSKLEIQNLPPLRPMVLDDLHSKALKNLHLEMGTGPVLYLLSPSYSVLHPTASEVITDFTTKKESLLDYLREYIIRNLAVYSVLLDINSYFIEQNSFLVLARLREKDSGGRRFEIKFYTNSPLELTTHYEDKIYIGRDFIDLFGFKRKHYGVKELIASVKDQNERMIDKAQEKLKNPLEYKSFFQEIKELVAERQPPQAGGAEVKLLYGSQIGTAPPTFAIVSSRPDAIPDHYLRFVANGLRKRFGFRGVPIRVRFTGRRRSRAKG